MKQINPAFIDLFAEHGMEQVGVTPGFVNEIWELSTTLKDSHIKEQTILVHMHIACKKNAQYSMCSMGILISGSAISKQQCAFSGKAYGGYTKVEKVA